MHDDAPQAHSALRAEVERPRSRLDQIVPAVIAATAIVMTVLVVTNGSRGDARSATTLTSAPQPPARAAAPAPSPSPAPAKVEEPPAAPPAAPVAKAPPAPRAQPRTVARTQPAKAGDAKAGDAKAGDAKPGDMKAKPAASGAPSGLEPLPDFPIPGEPKS